MIKENLKENVVEAPTLFIGVGGTGSKIVKKVVEKCRPGEIENMSFVCLDTNVNDLSGVEGSKAKIYAIQTSNTQTVGDYLDYDMDALKNWFPKNAVMYDKTVSEGAGQVRAISRLALNSTIKTGKITPLYDAIDELFRKDGKKMKQALRIVFVSTASGGTGSGIILPLAMFVRDYVKNKYPQTGVIVRAMILLPETLDNVIKSSAERESQRRNAYATIKEINAFMMKGSGFFDIADELNRYKDLHVDVAIAGSNETKPLALLPFDFCFLLDGQNSEDNTLVDFEQYKEQAAQALYEQNIGPMQLSAFSTEDNIIKEMSNPGNYGRNRFGGIGASILRYPYDTIADYIAFGWAMDSIGGESEAAKWTKYDRAYDVKMQEARKKGLSMAEAPKRGEVYNSTLTNATDSFSKDVRSKFLGDANKRVTNYLKALATQMHKSLDDNAMIKATRNASNHLGSKINYEDNDANRGKANDNLSRLREFETAIRMNSKKVAESAAESIFINESKTINAKESYTLEYLLKNSFGDVSHPNAARFLLYLVEGELRKRVLSTNTELNNYESIRLALYAPDADKANVFDANKTRKETEANIDDFCAAEESLKGAYNEDYYTNLNKHLKQYHDDIVRYGELVAEHAAYKMGAEYVAELNKAFEKFFGTFGDKVAALARKREDIVDALKFHKGDSVFNICSSEAMLKELALTTKSQSEEGALLDSELNAKIFDAVKANVVFEREIRNADIVEDDRRIDVFDDIILGYFRNNVRETCDTINLNIIEAIAMENRLNARIKMREQQGDSNEKLFDQVTHQDNLRYIIKMVEKGKRLAAPGIQSIRNEEARVVGCCAYNKSLLDMRNYRTREIINGVSDGVPAESISRYELHFFNALYNVTPDKLKKFSCAYETETGAKNPGLYHNAYINYVKDIGPDSTKNMVISTHIDKRWDSIAVLPEIDFGFQNSQLMKIYQAMIYGLVYKAIGYRKYSANVGKKKVFKYETSEERMTDMIVSNGTLCDEFYEVLDSLYISSAIVEDIEKIKQIKRAKDSVRNSNYVDTQFAKNLAEFELDIVHPGAASLFEIPLAYYNSLPNSRRFADELASIVDAVIKTFRDELNKWERETDARFILCDVLKDQFKLLIENYNKYPALSLNIAAADNVVIDTIFRKVKNVLGGTPEPDDYAETVEEMKAAIMNKKA